jgi:hypothetical protein
MEVAKNSFEATHEKDRDVFNPDLGVNRNLILPWLPNAFYYNGLTFIWTC